MTAKLKINIAIVISVAFIFRLLFVNIGIISSLDASQSSVSFNSDLSLSKNKRTTVDIAVHSQDPGYYLAEIEEEEDSDDENDTKSSSLALLYFFCSQDQDKLKKSLHNISPFNRHFAFNSKRHLEYRVFRI